MIANKNLPEKRVRAGVIIPLLRERATFRQTLREEETAGLVEALDADCAFVQTLSIRKPNPGRLFGQGQLDAIRERLTVNDCDLFVVDGDLTPIQQRNLENALSCKVIDRTGLILEIFGLRASTRAGRLQVEVARLAYERSRLVRTWTHLERQRGGGGVVSGPGETQIEADRRMLDATLLRLRRQLKDVERTRGVQRAGRKAREIPIVALVGYTNAGKSTLFNALANDSVFAKDMPFATLDPTVRRVELPSGYEFDLVDTVGFITDLPTTLIEAFKGTLEETIDADLILHVHDSSSEDAEEQSDDVMEVLEELEDMLDADLPKIVDVWNKCDLLSADEHDVLASYSTENADSILVSAITRSGLETLTQLIETELTKGFATFIVRYDLNDGKIQSWLHQNTRVVSVDGEMGEGALMIVRMDQKLVGQLFRYADQNGSEIEISIHKEKALHP